MDESNSIATERMQINHPEENSLFSDDEINTWELLAVFRRRWIWIASGGLLGIAVAGMSLLKPPAKEASTTEQSSIRMVVDVALGPCFSAMNTLRTFKSENVQRINCSGEFYTSQYQLERLAAKKLGSDESFNFDVKPLALPGIGEKSLSSTTQVALEVFFNRDDLPHAQGKIEEIKKDFYANQFSNAKRLSGNLEIQTTPGQGWISIENNSVPKPKPQLRSPAKSLALGLLGGLFLGGGSAMIRDRMSDRIFSNTKILRQLSYPLWLTLPLPPWSDQAVDLLIGQLSDRLDRSFEWRVLSIAHEHELVKPLAQSLIRQSEPGLSCKPVEPLLNSIIRLSPDARPIGLLIVVEPGFNSSQALEDAHLLLSQLSCVQSIGVVLAGVPLPSELAGKQKT